MNRFEVFKRLAWSVLVVGVLAFVGGCEGSDGKDGADGARGADGSDGADGVSCWDLNANGVGDVASEDINGDGVVDVNDCGAGNDPIQAAIDEAQIESCATCHAGVGDQHQAVYDPYTTSDLVLEFTNVDVQPGLAGGFDVTVDFDVTLAGAPYIDPVGSGLSVDSTAFYFVEYDAATGQWLNEAGGFSFGLSAGNIASNGDGSYTLEQNVSVDPSAFANGGLVGRIAKGVLPIPKHGRITQYDNNASDVWEFGNINAFVSPANAEGCELCHGTPYYKHGNYPGQVAGSPDFTICKACHNNSSAGGHPEWQFMVDNPAAWAAGTPLTPEEQALYAYDRTLVNDVHMSHAMEFPYPQSMANCKTCHEGNLAQVLDNSNFAMETCKSCHVLRGINANDGDDYYQSHRPPPFPTLWADTPAGDVRGLHAPLTNDTDCTACHTAGPGAIARPFSAYHTGYDPLIYDDAGNRYADMYTASIDAIAYDAVANTITVDYSVSDAAVVPELLVSFYGWDSKDFIVPSHVRDSNSVRFEFEPGDVNPLFTADAAVVAPDYRTTANLAVYAPAPELLDDIPTLIANMDVTKVEIILTPYIDIGGQNITLDSVTQTYDLVAGAQVSDYFQGDGAIVDYENCNACHDQLAVTFHSGSGRAGEMTMCRSCHASTNPGSHLEMQSRSIESYVHAIHSFQDFDPGDIFDAAEGFDAVNVARYNMHIEHEFPYFTRLACEACHNEGTYNVPDQSKSMPGALSAADMMDFWYSVDPATGLVSETAGRNIGAVPEYVVGAASKACGGCHRADLINEDRAGDLAAFNAHTGTFGTLAENDTADGVGTDTDDEVLYGIMKKIMTLFE